MTDYLVKLTPLTPFFFGGENTFGEGEETNYFAKYDSSVVLLHFENY